QESPCQLLGTLSSTACVDLVSKADWTFKFVPISTPTTTPSPTCESPSLPLTDGWELTLATDTAGQICNGSLDTLMEYLKAGKKVAVLVSNPSAAGSNPTATLGVGQEVEITQEGHVCVHLPFSISPTSWSAVDKSDAWVFRKVCSTGTVQEWTVNATAVTNSVRPTHWYTSTGAWDKVLDTTPGGSQGSTSDLKSSLETGSDVIMMTLNAISNAAIFYPGSAWISQGSWLTATHVWAVRKADVSDALGPSSVLQMMSFSPRSSSITDYAWSLAGQGSEVTQETTPYSVYVDPGWRFVHTSSSSPSSSKSSRPSSTGQDSHDDLLQEIRGGHRVRLAVSHQGSVDYFTADHVIISPEQLVIAQVLSSDETGATNGYLIWHLFRSDGVWVTYRVQVPGYSMDSQTSTGLDIRWFVDNKIYDVAMETYKSSVSSGSLSGLRDRALAIHYIRLKVERESEAGVEHFFSADEIILGPEPEEGISALSMRGMSIDTSVVAWHERSKKWSSAGQGRFGVTHVSSTGTILYWDSVFGNPVGDSAVTSSDGVVTWFVGK
ncbi:hypothetical protein EGW08_010736, partial [Elysia chlorotica]